MTVLKCKSFFRRNENVEAFSGHDSLETVETCQPLSDVLNPAKQRMMEVQPFSGQIQFKRVRRCPGYFNLALQKDSVCYRRNIPDLRFKIQFFSCFRAMPHELI